MINLSNVIDNINFELSNGVGAKKAFMCILFVASFLLGKLSVASFIAYVSDKFENLFSGDEDEL